MQHCDVIGSTLLVAESTHLSRNAGHDSAWDINDGARPAWSHASNVQRGTAHVDAAGLCTVHGTVHALVSDINDALLAHS